VTEPENDDATPEPAPPPPAGEDPLLTEQEHKGFGEDEGERDESLADE
jgi:hypothetical protein